MTGKHRATSGPLRKACYPPPPVARHYGVRIMCRLCSYISPAQKSSAGLLPFKGRGPWLFVTQHGRHKSKSRNADFIIIAPKGETTHYILRVASAPSPSVVTDSLDFQVADAPLQIQFASAKCVRCAPQGRYHNLRAAGPSNLRTLRTLSPAGAVNLPL